MLSSAHVAYVISVSTLFALFIDRSQCFADVRSSQIRGPRFLNDDTINTIPQDVKCEKKTICDSKNYCAIVCQRGTVMVEQWLQEALKLQRQLAYKRDICTAQLPGTHNSAITLADGYGVEDHVFERILRFTPWKGDVRTNDQHFSLTDQLEMGVRLLELDVHYVNKKLTIAHCGGFQSKDLDHVIDSIKSAAKLSGIELNWNTGLIGCNPSFSGIPSIDQRTLVNALEEISGWLTSNKDEFLMVFLDDDEEIEKQGQVEELVNTISASFDLSIIFTPKDKDTAWPTFDEMIKRGKRILFMSGTHYASANTILFTKADVCSWKEPSLPLESYPACKFASGGSTVSQIGTVFRPQTSEILYGPLNASGELGPNVQVLNESTIPGVVQCGTNYPSPDLLTPKRAESFIWTFEKGFQRDPRLCLGLSKSSPNWKNIDCTKLQATVAACRSVSDPRKWNLSKQISDYESGAQACLAIGSDMVFSVPASGYENQLVMQQLSASSNLIHQIIFDLPPTTDVSYAVPALYVTSLIVKINLAIAYLLL